MALAAWQNSLRANSQSSFGGQSNIGLSLGSLPIRNYAVLGASKEYSVAYFGFDSKEILDEFVAKYNNFVVEVDNNQKYTLQVSRALYQTMPSIKSKSDEK